MARATSKLERRWPAVQQAGTAATHVPAARQSFQSAAYEQPVQTPRQEAQARGGKHAAATPCLKSCPGQSCCGPPCGSSCAGPLCSCRRPCRLPPRDRSRSGQLQPAGRCAPESLGWNCGLHPRSTVLRLGQSCGQGKDERCGRCYVKRVGERRGPWWGPGESGSVSRRAAAGQPPAGPAGAKPPPSLPPRPGSPSPAQCWLSARSQELPGPCLQRRRLRAGVEGRVR